MRDRPANVGDFEPQCRQLELLILPRAHSSKGWISPERGKEGAVGQVLHPLGTCSPVGEKKMQRQSLRAMNRGRLLLEGTLPCEQAAG